MDVNQAVRRIVLRHAPVLLCAVLVALAVVYGIHRDERPEYEASARVLMSPEPVRSAAEADAVAARARGLATSRRAAQGALEATGIERPVEELVERTTVTPLGTSTVASVAVRDADPVAAARLADAVAAQVVALYDRAGRAALQVAVREVDQQAAQVAARRQKAERLRASGDPLVVAGAVSQLAQLDREAEAVDALRRELTLTAARRTGSELVDPATVPLDPLPSALLQDAVLAVLVALLVGCGIGGALEALRPTLVGSRAVARALQVPLLADLRHEPGQRERAHGPGQTRRREREAEYALLAAELRVAARRRNVDRVLVVPAVPGRQAAELAEVLRRAGATASAPVEPAAAAPRHEEKEDADARVVHPWSSALAVAVPGRPVLLEHHLARAGTGDPASNGARASLLPLPHRTESLRLMTGPAQPLRTQHPTAVDRCADPGPASAAATAPAGGRAPGPAGRRRAAGLDIQVLGVASLASTSRATGTGLLVLSPRTVRASALDDVTDLASTTGWPVLGLVGYRSRRRWGRARRESA